MKKKTVEAKDYDPSNPEHNPFKRSTKTDRGQGLLRKLVYDLICAEQIGMSKSDVLRALVIKSRTVSANRLMKEIDLLQHLYMIQKSGLNRKREAVYVKGPKPFDAEAIRLLNRDRNKRIARAAKARREMKK